MFFYLALFSHLSALPFLIYYIFKIRVFSRDLRFESLVFLYVFFSFLIDTINLVVIKFDLRLNINVITNFYTLISFVILILIFHNISKWINFYRKTVNIIFLFILILNCILLYYNYNSLNTQICVVSYSLFFLISFIFILKSMFWNQNNIPIFSIYFLSGICLFSICSLIPFLFEKFSTSLKENYFISEIIWSQMLVSNILKNTILTVGLWKNKEVY